jgi:DNA-binding MarR family transcriptional regulator
LTIVVQNEYIGFVRSTRSTLAEPLAPTPDHEVFLGIVRAAEMLTRHLAETLTPFQLTVSQYSVLDSLRRAGDAGLACGAIADRLITRDPDITRLIDRLEDRGLVIRRRERPDRRVVRAQITKDGLLLLARLDAPIARLHTRHLAPMGKRNLGMLSALLRAAETAGYSLAPS